MGEKLFLASEVFHSVVLCLAGVVSGYDRRYELGILEIDMNDVESAFYFGFSLALLIIVVSMCAGLFIVGVR